MTAGPAMTPEPGALRGQFLLDPSVTYLNHGGFGACPRPVFEAYQHWQLELERQPTAFMMQRRPGLLRDARARLAAYLNTAPGNLIFVTNATTGVNHVAQALDLQPGDEILTTDHEYGALERMWEFIGERQGTRLIRQPLPLPLTDAEQVVEAFWQGVTPYTRVIFLSHITSPTALTLPVAEICARARQAGLLTIIDGAHAPGQLPLALDDLGADFYAGNCHKWMGAPKGAGFLYARPERHDLVRPLVVSWEDEDAESDFVRRNQRTGTRDLAAFLSVPAALDFMQAHDWPAQQARCHDLARVARQALHEWSGAAPLCTDSPQWYAQMCTVLLPGDGDPAQLQAQLYEHHRLQVVLGTWQARLFLRVSVQAYNTTDDITRMMAALRASVVW